MPNVVGAEMESVIRHCGRSPNNTVPSRTIVALESAFKSYFAFKSAHPDQVKKPLLYFVDYGLPSTTPRGYVFNMETLTLVDGPFIVAHGRGSSAGKYGVPTRFGNSGGSGTTSLGV